MKNLIALALLTGTALAHAQAAAPAPSSPAKKELVAKIVALQQPSIDNLARSIGERPAAQLMQFAGNILQTKVAPDKREVIGKSVEADIKKYVEDSAPLMKERSTKLGPAITAPMLDERFSEEELKQIADWLDSPVNKKFQQFSYDLIRSLEQKLVVEAAPLLEPKLKALEQKVRASLGVPPAQPASGAAPAAAPAKKAASK